MKNSETYEIINLDAQKYLRVEVTATDDGVGTPSQQSTIANSNYYYVNNSTPVAQQIEYSDVLEDNVYIVDAPGLLVNDLDPDNDANELPSYFGLSAFVVNQPTNGEVVLNSNGSFTYTPNENFNGNDSFEYRVYDGTLYSDENASVNISVASVNDVPQFNLEVMLKLQKTLV